MEYVILVLAFTIICTVACAPAGAIALQLSPDMYREKGRAIDHEK